MWASARTVGHGLPTTLLSVNGIWVSGSGSSNMNTTYVAFDFIIVGMNTKKNDGLWSQYDDLTGEITKIGNTRGRQHTRTNNSQRNVVREDYREGSEAERSDDESEAGATGGVE
ncbi:hypothetical protein DPMN_133009 [Dreissena polymorpha]|uniref:Uncharacterized protein n=1 Tax=Dreissena polymorpha TaxID=45954 RepID=A0A9D4FUU6_DREPO|nr:hypothetical protein DPMN_133009 [Dreissena polymorpha]